MKRRSSRDLSRTAGFTLLELLVVLVILGLLAAIAAPQVFKHLGGAKTDSASLQIKNLGATLDLYRLDVGHYPTTEEGLDALLEQPSGNDRWNGPYIKSADSLTDPWGYPYAYRFPGQNTDYDLYSLGADNAEGGEGENSDVTD